MYICMCVYICIYRNVCVCVYILVYLYIDKIRIIIRLTLVNVPYYSMAKDTENEAYLL